MIDEIPLADQGRVDIAERTFGEYKTMSPEEWAARFSHTVGASSFGEYRYDNPVLHSWIHRLHEILKSPQEIKKYRKKFLAKEEIQRIEDEENDPSQGL